MSNTENVETGERFAKSPLTGNYYRVTKWVDLGDGKIRSQQKERIDRCDVPERWLQGLDKNE